MKNMKEQMTIDGMKATIVLSLPFLSMVRHSVGGVGNEKNS